jgi:hypothetical protein
MIRCAQGREGFILLPKLCHNKRGAEEVAAPGPRGWYIHRLSPWLRERPGGSTRSTCGDGSDSRYPRKEFGAERFAATFELVGAAHE